MAQRYHDHPALARWHVSNEYGCHNTPCFCDTCAAGFRTWLSERYPDLDALNNAWGTAFWSQSYTDLAQVLPPRATPTFANPGQQIDYARYQSDAILGQFLAERAVLHEHSPGVPVTTNFMTMRHFDRLDYHRWWRQVGATPGPSPDIVSTDHYLVDALEDPHAELAFCGDLTRGIADGSWMLMEHSTSAVNWQPVNRPKPPGQLLRDSLTHVSRGADAIGFFQWRASRAGAEKFHSALVPHAGTDTRLFAEVCRLGEVSQRLDELAGSRVEAEVAILWDYQAYWATTGPALPSTLVGYPDLAIDLHRSLREQHVTADVVHPSADLSRYRLLVVPTLYLVSDEHAAAIITAVDAGAHLLVTYFSGIVDESDHVRLGGYPGAFRDVLGVRAQEFAPLREGERVALTSGGTATVWSEDIEVRGAEVVDTFRDGPVPGRPALTRYAVSGTTRWYLATRPDRHTLDAMVTQLLAEAGVAPVIPDVDPAVDLVRRRSARGSWLFAINTGDRPVQVPARGHDLVADARVDGMLELAGGAAAVVREA